MPFLNLAQANTVCNEPIYLQPSRSNTLLKISFNTIGTLGTVTNVAGHIFNGNINMYNGASDDLPVPSRILRVPPPSQPLAPDLWFGRDQIVLTLAQIITGNENPRLAILGAGGMGKTSTALHVIHHEAVVARYKDRIFFVACDAATSADLLASLILQVIGVSVGTGENLVTALHLALKYAPPTLLLLDNFESLWEAEKDHTSTRDLLQKIADSFSVGYSLPPLPAPSAKELFLAINATFCDGSDDGDEVLNELLMELDYVPLAIHLLAHVSADFSPRFVLKQWQKQRTRMLSLDSYTTDKLESIDVSISLSMASLGVDLNFDAIQLLGMLCLLPDRLLRWQDKLEVIEKTFETAPSSLFLLRKFALVYTTGAKLGTLSPIRHFILQHYPPDSQRAQCISNIIWELVCTHAMVEFGPKFHGAVEALSPEMGNIDNLIDHAIACDPREIIVDISIKMSWHLSRTYPSSHLLKKVSDLVPSVPIQMQAQYIGVSGATLYNQHEYVEAASAFTQARPLFLEISDLLGAAHCSRRLGDILTMQDKHSEATTILTNAQVQFQQSGECLGAAQCSRTLGAMLYMQSKYSDAAAILTDARAQFVEIGNRLGAAQYIFIMQSNYSEATAILTDARTQSTEIGDRLNAAHCSRILGDILRMQSNHSEATAILTDARAQFIEIGDLSGAAHCSLGLGDILRMRGGYSEATAILTDARAKFIDIEDRLAEDLLTRARSQFIAIGFEEWTAYCSVLLKQCIRARDDEAIMETSS
ncbi:hypothetical protein FIBSPDRAFT_932583 [Athelia psychrophila]|uniref:TPR-like protein n=1 Tax=Athelia psychrophila TaxID=1759441 RepID=A0A166IMT6_9AGAM|nr:hypothetical protein FIBSPDRAFT_932580 [Fibularhizoctonia sp. CBS 109695]KZP19997.1 hypothetical protein FIBSPDRAFT_932583 [Fibularhizoctonia sp. CBS 109695]